MTLQRLIGNWGGSWPALGQAITEAEAKLGQLRTIVKGRSSELPFDSEDVSLVVFGSLARREWTSGSDLDWTLLIDGGADHQHAITAHEFSEECHREGFKKPGPTATFGNLTFSHNLIHQIGGQDDTNRNTTQRMLLLLESCALHRSEAYDRAIQAILHRYLQNDFREFRLKIPRFLLNDLHRFWRTMCVDYASKYRERAGEGWAIRIIKLRMSRKLIFVAGLVMCYSCHPELMGEFDLGLKKDPSIDRMVHHLKQFVAQSPLDILCDALLRWSNHDTAHLILNSYEEFLKILNDESSRQYLANLAPTASEEDKLLKHLQEQSRCFAHGLERMLHDDNRVLAAINREYGVL